MRRARRRHGPPPSPPPPSLEERGRLNEAGVPPTSEGLRRAFERIEPGLSRCAARGAGRLLIEATLDGTEGVVDSFELFGEAAPAADGECVADALANLRFAPFPDQEQVYWAVRY